MQGQRDLQAVAAADHERAHAARRRPARRVLPRRARRRRPRRRAAARRGLRLRPQDERPDRVPRSARGWSARRRSRASRSGVERRPRRTTSRSPRAWARRAPADLVVLPILFEDQVLGVIELASLQPFTEVTPGVPRPAHRDHRRRLNTIIANVAHRGAAGAVAAADAGAAGAVRGAAAQTNDELEEKAALLAQQNRDIEIKNARDRAGPRGARGAGRAARAVLEVQVASSWPTCATSCARRSTAC